jgi:hypothetical protein
MVIALPQVAMSVGLDNFAASTRSVSPVSTGNCVFESP